MTSELRQVLMHLAKEFSKHNITWGLGASSLLNYHGLVDIVNDLDILVIPDDIEKVENILFKIGKKEISAPSEVYSNEYFGEFVIDEVNIHVMSRMTITNHGVTYVYPFDEKSIVDYWMMEDVRIPMTSLEEWYILYHMIPNKEKKVKLLDEYFSNHEVKNPDLIKRADNLPDWIANKLQALL